MGKNNKRNNGRNNGRNKRRRNRGGVLILMGRPVEPEKNSRYKAVLLYSSIILIGLLVVGVSFNQGNIGHWFRSLFHDSVETQREQKKKEISDLLTQYEANKDKISQETRTDLFIGQKRLEKMLKKYLSHREYTVYMMIEYMSNHRRLEDDERKYQAYCFGKLYSNMTPGEIELLEGDMNVFDRLKDELKQIDAQKSGADKPDKGDTTAEGYPGPFNQSK